MKQSRREFVTAAALLWQAAAARAQHSHPDATPAQYHFAFLAPPERETLRTLMARIVPADGRSGGAMAANVDAYIDFVLSHGDGALQEIWHDGLRGFGAAVQGKDDETVDAFLAQQAQNEFSPATSDEKFFVILKAAVAEGFYTSEIGIKQELGYQGMTFLLDFPGCTHPDHTTPADYKPLLRQTEEA